MGRGTLRPAELKLLERDSEIERIDSVLAVLATIAAVADLGVQRLLPTATVPAIRGSRSETRLILTGVAGLFIALKFLFHIHFSLFGFGFWAAVVLAVAFVYLARRLRGAETAA
jgi:hypothetical protein